MVDNLPVFVVVTVDTCGPCKAFKRDHWPKLKKTLEDSKTVRIKHINLADFKSPLPTDVPADLKRFIPHYPTFSLITADSWNKKGTLNGLVFGKDWTPEGKLVASERQLSYSDIPAWVSSGISTLSTSQPSKVKLVDDRQVIISHKPGESVFQVPTYCSSKFVGNS